MQEGLNIGYGGCRMNIVKSSSLTYKMYLLNVDKALEDSTVPGSRLCECQVPLDKIRHRHASAPPTSRHSSAPQKVRPPLHIEERKGGAGNQRNLTKAAGAATCVRSQDQALGSSTAKHTFIDVHQCPSLSAPDRSIAEQGAEIARLKGDLLSFKLHHQILTGNKTSCVIVVHPS